MKFPKIERFMKALKAVFRQGDQTLEVVVCKRLDAVSSMTVCSDSKSSNSNVKGDLHFPYEIDHWNIVDGVITVYYKNGLIMEVTRIPNL